MNPAIMPSMMAAIGLKINWALVPTMMAPQIGEYSKSLMLILPYITADKANEVTTEADIA